MKIKLSHPQCLPKVGSKYAAGMDLRAYFGDRISDDVRCIRPGESLMIDTGVACNIPKGMFGHMVPRSSLGKRRLIIANTCGVIDADYTGNIKMNLVNMGDEDQVIYNFDRLCQLVVIPHYNLNCLEVVDQFEEYDRGTAGFGSTGTN